MEVERRAVAIKRPPEFSFRLLPINYPLEFSFRWRKCRSYCAITLYAVQEAHTGWHRVDQVVFV